MAPEFNYDEEDFEEGELVDDTYIDELRENARRSVANAFTVKEDITSDNDYPSATSTFKLSIHNKKTSLILVTDHMSMANTAATIGNVSIFGGVQDLDVSTASGKRKRNAASDAEEENMSADDMLQKKQKSTSEFCLAISRQGPSNKRKLSDSENEDSEDDEPATSIDAYGGTILSTDLPGDFVKAQQSSSTQHAPSKRRRIQDALAAQQLITHETGKRKRLPNGQKARLQKAFKHRQLPDSRPAEPEKPRFVGGMFRKKALPQEILNIIFGMVLCPSKNPTFIRRPLKNSNTGANEPSQTMIPNLALFRTCKDIHIQARIAISANFTVVLPMKRMPSTGFQLNASDLAVFHEFHRIHLRPYITKDLVYRKSGFGQEVGCTKIGRAFTDLVQVLKMWNVMNSMKRTKVVSVEMVPLYHDTMPGKEDRRAKIEEEIANFVGMFRQEVREEVPNVRVVNVQYGRKRNGKAKG
jgi:hypothetical protein